MKLETFKRKLCEEVPEGEWDLLARRYWEKVEEFWEAPSEGWYHPDWDKLREGWLNFLKSQLASWVYFQYYDPKNTRRACRESDDFIVKFNKWIKTN